MTAVTEIESLQFKIEEPRYVEAGEDYREQTRLYESGVVGQVHLFLNGTELVAGNKIPAEFELSNTVATMHQMLSQLQTEGYVETTPFCCVCGDRGCTYIRWTGEQSEEVIFLTMETLSDKPVGDHQYQIQSELLLETVTDLTDTVITTLREVDVEETTAGTIHEFQRRKKQF